jgi:hypothetical protein
LVWQMGLGKRLRNLWHLRAGVVASLLVALLVSAWSVQRISLFPPGLTPRSLEMATAATHVVVDTPTSSILDLRQDTYSLEGLTNRAVLLGNIMASTPVLQEIAARADVPPELLQIEAPLTPHNPRAPVEAGHEKRTSDILRSTDQYRLTLQANPTVPMLDIYAETPNRESAARLANASVEVLRGHLGQLATAGAIPAGKQIQLRQLGRARGTIINESVRWQVALVAFLITFAMACATTIFIARVRDGWRDAIRDEAQARTDDPHAEGLTAPGR